MDSNPHHYTDCKTDSTKHEPRLSTQESTAGGPGLRQHTTTQKDWTKERIPNSGSSPQYSTNKTELEKRMQQNSINKTGLATRTRRKPKRRVTRRTHRNSDSFSDTDGLYTYKDRPRLEDLEDPPESSSESLSEREQQTTETGVSKSDNSSRNSETILGVQNNVDMDSLTVGGSMEHGTLNNIQDQSAKYNTLGVFTENNTGRRIFGPKEEDLKSRLTMADEMYVIPSELPYRQNTKSGRAKKRDDAEHTLPDKFACMGLDRKLYTYSVSDCTTVLSNLPDSRASLTASSSIWGTGPGTRPSPPTSQFRNAEGGETYPAAHQVSKPSTAAGSLFGKNDEFRDLRTCLPAAAYTQSPFQNDRHRDVDSFMAHNVQSIDQLNAEIVEFDMFLKHVTRKRLYRLLVSSRDNTHPSLLHLFQNKLFNVSYILAQASFNRGEKDLFAEWKLHRRAPEFCPAGMSSDELSKLVAACRDGSGSLFTAKHIQRQALCLLYPQMLSAPADVRLWNRQHYNQHGDLLNAMVKVLTCYQDLVDDEDDDNDNNKSDSTVPERGSEASLESLVSTPIVYYSSNTAKFRISKQRYNKVIEFYRSSMRTWCAQQKMDLCKQHNEAIRINSEISRQYLGTE